VKFLLIFMTLSRLDDLFHGYDTIDDRIVWGVIEEDLDNLIADAEKLINQK